MIWVVIIFGFAVVIALQLYLIKMERHMSKELDRLTASVAAEEGAVTSLTTLVTGLADLIRNSANDPAALNALADSLDAETATINAAVVANPLPTPAPAPAPTPATAPAAAPTTPTGGVKA